MDLSIIIVSWNTRDLLEHCLDSVAASPPSGGCEIIVVDNASADGSAAMVEERFPQVRLIRNSGNLGFVAANNQALPLTCGRHVLLLNSDTVVQPHALSSMVAFADAHTDAGIVGGYVLNPDGTPQACFWNFPTILSETAYAWGLDSRKPFSRWFGPRLGFREEFIQVDWVLGAALLIRRDALARVGLLDEQFFMYSEEVDWCYRVRQAGWNNYVLGTARIVHWGGQSSRRIPARAKALLFRSKVQYFLKHRGAPAAVWVELVFDASLLSRYWLCRLNRRHDDAEMWAEARKHFRSTKRWQCRDSPGYRFLF